MTEMKKEETGVKNANGANGAKVGNTTINTVAPTTTKTPTPIDNGTLSPTTEKETKPATVPTANNATPTPQPTKAETIEELKKRLEMEIARLNQKQEIAEHRETFINKMESLKLYIRDLKNENGFETQTGKLTFAVLTSDHFNRSNFADIFSISNTALISKFCDMLLSEMQVKIAALETELLTA
jgi:hypothetical protein